MGFLVVSITVCNVVVVVVEVVVDVVVKVVVAVVVEVVVDGTGARLSVRFFNANIFLIISIWLTSFVLFSFLLYISAR